MAKALIVEDYPSLQQTYRTVLESEGYQVQTASDGGEALKLAADFQPDVILLDLLMAKVDGLEFLKTYKPAEHPKTKVVVFSNFASPELVQEVTALGAAQYLVKAKFTPKELADYIKKLG